MAPAQPPVVVAEHLATKVTEPVRQPEPVVKQPEQKQPQAKQPEVKHPEPKQPELKLPEPKQPEPEPMPIQVTQPEPVETEPVYQEEGDGPFADELEETEYSAIALYDYQACELK